MDDLLPPEIKELREQASKIAKKFIEPKRDEVDQKAMWPEHSMKALADAGLLGLNAPKDTGGLQQGLLALAVVTEEIAKVDPSSAMCYAMHCVGTAVIASKATSYHKEHYLKPIAEGKHITTLALSEPGTGIHFYFPETDIQLKGNDYILNGVKDFITNGGHADSYVISTLASEQKKGEGGKFNCMVIDNNLKGMTWHKPWNGVGMRGNSSKGVDLQNVSIPKENLLGEEGDQDFFVFQIVAPFFLIAMAGTYVGIAQAAYDQAREHMKNRQYTHTGKGLMDIQVLQTMLADMWINVEKTRALLYEAALKGDRGDEDALIPILACKADAGDTAVKVTNDAMTLSGGKAYAANSFLAHLLRDARASHVMAPTTTILKDWLGKSLLGLEIP